MQVFAAVLDRLRAVRRGRRTQVVPAPGPAPPPEPAAEEASAGRDTPAPAVSASAPSSKTAEKWDRVRFVSDELASGAALARRQWLASPANREKTEAFTLVPGVRCPGCGSPIVFLPGRETRNGEFPCTHCGLKLRYDTVLR